LKQADADTLLVREQADVDIAQADSERDEALARVTALESELAVLSDIVTNVSACCNNFAKTAR